jgi:competence protein ComEA
MIILGNIKELSMKAKKIAGCLAVLLLFSALASGLYAKDEEKLDLNKATVEELSKVPELNQDMAKKIIELREENGEFVDMEELLDIPGINTQLLRKLKKHLFIKELDDCNC